MDAITRAQISSDALDTMARAVLAAAARYPSTPPDLLLPVVNEHIQRLRDAIEATNSARMLRRMVQLTGRPSEAAALADQAVALVSRTGNPRREAWVKAMAARAHAAIGEQSPAPTTPVRRS